MLSYMTGVVSPGGVKKEDELLLAYALMFGVES
jgi:hypothetical protein